MSSKSPEQKKTVYRDSKDGQFISNARRNGIPTHPRRSASGSNRRSLPKRGKHSPSREGGAAVERLRRYSFRAFLRGLLCDLGLRFTRCCGGLFATTSTARSKRAHASECSSFVGSGFGAI
jgi:hypothetical protein